MNIALKAKLGLCFLAGPLATGTAPLVLGIPADHALVGARFHCQCLAVKKLVCRFSNVSTDVILKL